MPTYIDYLNAFWRLRETTPISAGEADLYYALLHIANRLGWPESFPYKTSKLTLFLEVPNNT
ncbi:MAG: hypothetical protein LUC85_04175, partial [Bacteroidales bacterium]|nr:hypothetical protein [Bacteroidales bacterium]MCD8394017.1 hypothetical protein [Bacteroidales bacterium]